MRMTASRQTDKLPARFMNHKPDAHSPLAPTSYTAAVVGHVAQPSVAPVQARFGHDFSRLALTANSAASLQREASEEEELHELAEKNIVSKSFPKPPGDRQEQLIQRQIDVGKLNIVGEDHREYNKQTRQAEQQKVTAIFGDGTYHTEDTFSAMPDVAQMGRSPEEQDKLQTFASKADPPYYAITQGLEFIIGWCTEYKSFGSNRNLLVMINSAQARIEQEIISGPLEKLVASSEEKNFVLAHDTLLARFEQIDDPNYPRENLVGDPYIDYGAVGRPNRNLEQEVLEAVAALKIASEAYLLKIQVNYKQAKTEFEQFMGIGPDDDLIKKRSVTMGFHAVAHAFLGNKGVLKVGEYHLDDFATMDLGDVTLSKKSEMQEFLQARSQGGDGVSQFKSKNTLVGLRDGIKINDSVELEKEADTMGQKAMQLKLSLRESLTKGLASSVSGQRIADPRQPVQRLSDIPTADWKEQLQSRAELTNFPRFVAIALAANEWDGVSNDQRLEDLKKAISTLGQQMLADQSDVKNIYEAIKRYFPDKYLTIQDVEMVKKYNFDGPIAFTAENVMAWLRLAGGQGTVDDLRYIHHEIREIKHIQGTAMEHELVNIEPEENFWEEGYKPAHGAALKVEIDFLMHAVNRIYDKAYTWKHVAASDLERREDFLGFLYDKDSAKLPIDKETYKVDMNQVQADYGNYIDETLSNLLTQLKNKPLGSK